MNTESALQQLSAARLPTAASSPPDLRLAAAEEAAAVPLTQDSARERVRAAALSAGEPGPVGLELEGHLVVLDHPSTRASWAQMSAVLDSVPPLPGGSRVTVEPGGQIELSTAPGAGVEEAVRALRTDQQVLRDSLRPAGLGLAYLGADPARMAERVHPGDRYAAMETYFAATGNLLAGRRMMCSTASLQVNLEAGPAHRWAARVGLAHQLGPVLVAVSACSPLLASRRTGWASSRQHNWGELDQARCGPLLSGARPAEEWAEYALHAPVMLVLDPAGGQPQPMRRAASFSSWVSGESRLGGRTPTGVDLDYHLTTLFPPVRLRGFLELRYLDAVPGRWWPGLAALTTALLDSPVASDAAAEASEPVAGRWVEAARDWLADPDLALAARRCLSAAVAAAPDGLRGEVEAYAELVESGRSPGSALADLADRIGPAAALAEVAAGD